MNERQRMPATISKHAAPSWSISAFRGAPHRQLGHRELTGLRGGGIPTRRSGDVDGFLQTKLQLNQPGDRYEQKGDHLAEQVMRMPAPELHFKGT